MKAMKNTTDSTKRTQLSFLKNTYMAELQRRRAQNTQQNGVSGLPLNPANNQKGAINDIRPAFLFDNNSAHSGPRKPMLSFAPQSINVFTNIQLHGLSGILVLKHLMKRFKR